MRFSIPFLVCKILLVAALITAPMVSAAPLRLAALTTQRAPAPSVNAALSKVESSPSRNTLQLAAAHTTAGLWTQALSGALLPAESVEAWREFLGLGTQLGEAYKQLAEAAYRQQNYSDAARYFAVARDLLPEDDSFTGKLGFACKEAGEYEKAEHYLFQASVAEGADHNVWIWLGDVQRLLGKYDDAYVSMLAAVENAPQAEKENIQSYVNYTQGLASTVPDWSTFEQHREFATRHDATGRWRRVIAEYYKALDVAPAVGFEANDGPLRKAWVNKTVGSNYNHIKEFDVALDHWRRAIALYEEGESPGDAALVLQSLGVSYHWLADRDTPERDEYHRLALETWDRLTEMAMKGSQFDHVRYAMGAKLLDLIALRPLDDPDVVALREKVRAELPWSPPINDFSVAVIAESEIACRMREGDYAGARIVLDMVLPYFLDSNFLTESERGGRLLTALAHVYNIQGHFEQALAQSDRALTELAEFRGYLDADAFDRSSSGKTYRYIYAGRARAYLGQDMPEAALAELEAYKAKTRLDLLGSKILDETAKTDYRTEEELLRWRIPELKTELTMAATGRDEALEKHLTARIAKDETRLARLEKHLEMPPPGRLSLRTLETLDTAELRAALPGDISLAHFILDGYGGVAVVSGPEGVHGALLPGATDTVVRNLVNTFLDRRDDDVAAAETALGELYALLIAPVREDLTTEILCVATDETLSLLPFDALHDQGRPLIEDFALLRVPSGAYLAQALAQNRNRRDTALALVHRDGFAEGVETALAAGAFSTADARVADAATEAFMARKTEGYDVLHLSATADFLDGDAMLSSIELAPGDDADGSLHAAEMLTLSLPASLVVLDLAAQSGAATVPGRGLGALAEGLVHTGVPALIYNLWPDDAAASAAFFKAFYANLATMNKVEAVRAAKQELRAAGNTGYAWSAFELSGDYR